MDALLDFMWGRMAAALIVGLLVYGICKTIDYFTGL